MCGLLYTLAALVTAAGCVALCTDLLPLKYMHWSFEHGRTARYPQHRCAIVAVTDMTCVLPNSVHWMPPFCQKATLCNDLCNDTHRRIQPLPLQTAPLLIDATQLLQTFKHRPCFHSHCATEFSSTSSCSLSAAD